jgi:MYXO-CTERM domain-containing protein
MGYRLAACAAVMAVAGSIASADVIALWNIVTPFPTGAGNVPTGLTYSVGAADTGAVTVGTNLSSVHALPAATYTSPAGNGSALSFSSNNWSIGDYYQASVSTLGFTGVNLSWDQARSSTGPASFTLIMSTDGGTNWTTVLSTYAVLQSGGGGSPGTWSSGGTRNALYTTSVSVPGADNQASVLFRFQSLVAGAATGSNRIDNVEITGVPTPGAMGLLGLAGLVGLRRRR